MSLKLRNVGYIVTEYVPIEPGYIFVVSTRPPMIFVPEEVSKVNAPLVGATVVVDTLVTTTTLLGAENLLMAIDIEIDGVLFATKRILRDVVQN